MMLHSLVYQAASDGQHQFLLDSAPYVLYQSIQIHSVTGHMVFLHDEEDQFLVTLVSGRSLLGSHWTHCYISSLYVILCGNDSIAFAIAPLTPQAKALGRYSIVRYSSGGLVLYLRDSTTLESLTVSILRSAQHPGTNTMRAQDKLQPDDRQT